MEDGTRQYKTRQGDDGVICQYMEDGVNTPLYSHGAGMTKDRQVFRKSSVGSTVLENI